MFLNQIDTELIFFVFSLEGSTIQVNLEMCYSIIQCEHVSNAALEQIQRCKSLSPILCEHILGHAKILNSL